LRHPLPFIAPCLACLCLLGCDAGLLHDLDEPQANEVLALLQRANIEAHKEPSDAGRWDLTVPRGEQARAWELVQAHSLPKPRPPTLDELYPSAALMPSPQAERARLDAATSRRLEGSLLALEGVLDARVHLVQPAPSLGCAPEAPSASVLLRAARAAPLPSDAELRGLVAGSVEGLRPERVSLLVQRTDTPVPATDAPWASLGPWRVAQGDLALLRALLVGLLVLVLLQSAAIFWLLRRQRRPQAP
jgi:type III secretion protein J